ncbi:MAG: hypothetical protein COB04_15455 [Gammaproteobacteria bacterium]|nr:MAG: hypothetical protein COB04_15455 [Gammaproteobacteria bacterium]
MITLYVEVLGQQHHIAVFKDEGQDFPEQFSERDVAILYDEYCRVGRTLTEYEAYLILDCSYVLH